MQQTIQLPLSLHLRDDAIFDNFYVGQNQQLMHHLQLLVSDTPIEWFIYCYGEQGGGRSHLLQACCHALNLKGQQTFYLPLSYHAELSPDILCNLENIDLVCIDDIEQVMGSREWEEALFYFYNRARDSETRLLVSSNCSPKQLKSILPDLQTRLSNGLTLAVEGLGDQEKMKALQMRAANRGLTLSDDVTQYLMRHYSRNMRDLFTVLEKLDHASLAAKRRITVPFVRSVINSG